MFRIFFPSQPERTISPEVIVEYKKNSHRIVLLPKYGSSQNGDEQHFVRLVCTNTSLGGEGEGKNGQT